jgi:hypothetical protein
MNDDNFLDSLKIWYEHYHDLKDGKQTYGVREATDLAGSIIYHMHDERARICESLGLPAMSTAAEIIRAIGKRSGK